MLSSCLPPVSCPDQHFMCTCVQSPNLPVTMIVWVLPDHAQSQWNRPSKNCKEPLFKPSEVNMFVLMSGYPRWADVAEGV